MKKAKRIAVDGIRAIGRGLKLVWRLTLRAATTVSKFIAAQARRARAWIGKHHLVVTGGLLSVAAVVLFAMGQPTSLPEAAKVDMAIGFAAPGRPAFDRGWVVDVNLRAPTNWLCRGDTNVLVIVQGSREFWDDHPRGLRGGTWVGLGVAGLPVRSVKAGYLQDVASIEAAKTRGATPNFSETLKTRTVAPHGNGAILVYAPHWGRSRRPLLISFDSPDLAQRHDLASCWVAAPAVTGARSAVAQGLAEYILGDPRAPEPQESLAGHGDPLLTDSVVVFPRFRGHLT